MRYAVALISLLLTATAALASGPSNLIATGRTDTKLYVQWQGNGSLMFTLDYLGPESFGGLQPTCNDFPEHSNIFETTSDVEVIENLLPDTWYHIHVHAIDPVSHMTLDSEGSTNVMIVKTGPAGSGFEALVQGSPNYIICGGSDGGDDGGGDEGCAQVTLTLLPGSELFTEVQVTLVDPPSGNDLDTFALTIGEPQSVPEGSYHLRFSAPNGYAVTPVQRGLNVSCGDDISVRLRFRRSNSGGR
jgi:hypothetical protein